MKVKDFQKMFRQVGTWHTLMCQRREDYPDQYGELLWAIGDKLRLHSPTAKKKASEITQQELDEAIKAVTHRPGRQSRA